MSKNILIIGATGYVGGYLAKALKADGHAVRCLARNPAKAEELAALGCEVVKGDISDPASLQAAFEGIEAVYVSVQTLAAQPGSAAGQNFMDAETQGIANIVAACKEHGTQRLIYVTSLGIEKDSPSEWIRGRWKIEQSLLYSGLEVTILHPGMIVGKGGLGFGMTVRQAKSRVAIVLGSGDLRMRHIAIGDLVYYLIGVLEDERAFGQRYDVGADELYTKDHMIDLTAGILGGKPPTKIHIPLSLLATLAPIIERVSKASSKGAIKAIADGLNVEGIGDPKPIRAVLPKTLLTYREAVEAAA